MSALARFKSYPKYKDSGVEWLGEIPTEWKFRRADAFLRYEKRQVEPSSISADLVYHYSIPSVQETGEGALEPPSEIDSAKLTILGNRLLVSKLNPRKGVVLLAAVQEVPTICSTEFVPFEERGCDLRWAKYLFLAESTRQRLSAVVRSATRSHQRAEIADIVKMWHAVPARAEQQSIATFLDRETARIDALVAKKERLIELLREKRAALVEAAVRGDAKDPEAKLGHYVDLLPGYAFASENFSRDPEDIRLLRGVNVSPGAVRWEDTEFWPRDRAGEFAPYLLRAGDLVFGMDRPWVASGIRVSEIGAGDTPSLLLQRVARLRSKPGLEQRFLLLVLSSPQFRRYFEPILTGVSVPHVSPDQILSFRVRLPKPAVQAATAVCVEAELGRIQSLESALAGSIDRLRELRTALISAAVTGKIDVRGEAA